MSIGVKIYSAEGMLQISHDHMVPQFIGRYTAVQFGSDISEGAENNLCTRSYIVPNVNSQARDMVVYWYIPEGYWAYSQTTYLNGVNSGATIGLYLFVPEGAVISDVPVAYVFALNRVIRSPDPVAMRLWAANGDLNFDSGALHLSVEQLFTDMAYPVNQDHVSSLLLPWKPAFLIPDMYRDYEQFDGILNSPEGYAHFKEWMGCIKRAGNNLYGRELLIYEDFQWPAADRSRTGYTEDQRYGKNTNLVIPVINGGLYE